MLFSGFSACSAMNEGMRAEESGRDFLNGLQPMKRTGRPEEIAGAVLYPERTSCCSSQDNAGPGNQIRDCPDETATRGFARDKH